MGMKDTKKPIKIVIEKNRGGIIHEK